MKFLDLDNLESNARARVTEFQRKWATRYFSDMMDLQAGMAFRALPDEVKAQMKAADPAKYKKVERRFGGRLP